MECKELLSSTVASILALGSIEVPFNGHTGALFPDL